MQANRLDLVRSKIRAIADFPSPGILFRDITPLLADADARRTALELCLERIEALRVKIDYVVGMESRGFLFGVNIADALHAGFVPLRKPGKLPSDTFSESYALEYGHATLHMHIDALKPESNILIVDDLLATGGTANAAVRLVQRANARVVACHFLIELSALGGRKKLAPVAVDSLLEF